MIKFKNGLSTLLLGCIGAVFSSTAFSIPALQLGPTGYPTLSPDWNYDTGEESWVFTGSEGSSATLSAYANATKDDGGNGKFAWEANGTAAKWAYLVVAAVPGLGGSTGDNFDISVTGANFLTSGYGNPPVEDTNSLAPHGIFDTYFEIYRFRFDGAVGTIFDTQPPSAGSGAGYTEAFEIVINSMLDDVTALHFDLFTVSGNGVYTPGGPINKDLVQAFAPFSHDAEWIPEEVPDPPPPPPPVPAPGTVLLLGLGLASLSWMRRHS